MSVIYNAAEFESRSLEYTASYAFHNEETCGPRRISSPLGKLSGRTFGWNFRVELRGGTFRWNFLIELSGRTFR